MALQAKMKTKIKKRNDPVFARRFVTTGVMISAVMVIASIFWVVYFNPEAVAKRKMEEMAREYYEDYYYPKYMETADEGEFEKKRAAFLQVGFQPVPLRQLLLYKNEKNAGYRKYFEREGFSCDKNSTYAKFTPKEPFGAEDYDLEIELACEKE